MLLFEYICLTGGGGGWLGLKLGRKIIKLLQERYTLKIFPKTKVNDLSVYSTLHTLYEHEQIKMKQNILKLQTFSHTPTNRLQFRINNYFFKRIKNK